MLRDSIEKAFKQRSDLGYTKDPSGKLIKQGIQFHHGKMINLVKKEIITLGPLVRCARHDITLPGHIGTNVITLENMFQPSYLTEIQI